ncbi:MAG: hypothetical protein ACYTFU_12675 [Planctomycetota bacterium]
MVGSVFTIAPEGCWGSECDWRTGSVGHELASSKRSDGRGAMGDACVDTVGASETVIARARAFALIAKAVTERTM